MNKDFLVISACVFVLGVCMAFHFGIINGKIEKLQEQIDSLENAVGGQ